MKPDVTETLSGYQLKWLDVLIEVSRLRERGGQVVGEISIQTVKGQHPHLYRADFNFSSGSSRETLMKQLSERYTAEWLSILEQLCIYVLDAYRVGSPVEELWTSEEISPPEYLLYPLMPLNEPTVIYADGGTGKSYIALILYTCISLPWRDNPLGAEPKQKVNVLYLDWEMDRHSTQWRLRCLVKGMGLPDLPLYYRRCYQPIFDDIEGIKQAVIKVDAKCVIVDSIAAACGQVDLTKAEGAIGLYNSLRKLNVTSLLIGHTAKDPEARSKTIYGSAFFKNYARSAWELRSHEEENQLDVALFHRKYNISGQQKPIGLRLDFGTSETTVRKENVKDIPELADYRPQKERVLEFLAQGSFEGKEIAEGIGIPVDSVRTVCNRLLSEKKVVKLGKEWGLVYEEA